jgi:hypothetical protein
VQGDCPKGTLPVRTVDRQGKPDPADQAAAPERARKDAKDLERVEKERQQEEALHAKAAAEQQKRARPPSRSCKCLEVRMKRARDDAKDARLNHKQQPDRKAAKAQENCDLECTPQK